MVPEELRHIGFFREQSTWKCSFATFNNEISLAKDMEMFFFATSMSFVKEISLLRPSVPAT